MANVIGRQDWTNFRLTESQILRAREERDAAGPPWSELFMVIHGTPNMPQGESWRVAIRGFAPLCDDRVTYYVSNTGKFASLRVSEVRVWEQRESDYPKFVINCSEGKACRDVHKVVMEAFRGPCESGMCVRHVNSNPKCNNLNNLRYGSGAENTADRVRRAKGEVNVVLVPVTEKFAWHPWFPGLLVSNFGTARQYQWTVFREKKYLTTRSGRSSRKHAAVTVTLHGSRETLLLHRLVFETFVCKIPEGRICRHLDDDPHNNVVDNLQLGDAKRNAADRAANGRTKYGSDHPGAKYSDEQRSTLLSLVHDGMPVNRAARYVQMKVENAYRICTRRKNGMPVLGKDAQ